MASDQGHPRGRTRARPGHRHHQLAAALPQVTPEPARSHALRGNAAPDAPRPGFTPCATVTQSVTGCITTQSVGTINGERSRPSPWPNASKTWPPTPPACRRSTPSNPRACSFPRSAWECRPGRSASRFYALCNGDAERHGMHYHAERGNDQWRAIKAIPVAEREQDLATDTTSLPPLYPK